MEMKNGKQLFFTVDDEMHEQVKRAADEEYMRLGEWCTMVIEDKLREIKD
jgi:hypothetical protein